MKIDIIALLDFIEFIIRINKTHWLFEEPIKSLVDKHSDDNLIEKVHQQILLGNFEKSLELISEFKQANREFYSVYNSIQREYQNNVHITSKNRLNELIYDKFGIRNVEDVVTLIGQKDQIKDTNRAV